MAEKTGEILKGSFADGPVQGLEYETQTLSGVTDAKGTFQYRPNETVTFAVGGFVLGSARGAAVITPADMALDGSGDINKLRIEKVTNCARFLQSLDEDDNVENGITISDQTKSVVRRYRHLIDLEQPEDDFTNDENIKALFGELNKKLRTPAQARNQLRRTMNGIHKTTDVQIPMRDGAYLLGDIFQPIEKGKYPAILCLGSFGKCFHDGCICDEASMLEKEVVEDNWFDGDPQPSMWGGGRMPWEKGESANSTDWVPRGYVIVRIDARGVGKTPGMHAQFSLQEVQDLYDSIEWSAKQPWCNGNVGLWGTGLYAMNAMAVAQFQPPSLKAMIPVTTDIDSYRDFVYIGGGLYHMFNFVIKNTCGEWKGFEWIEEAWKHPFYDPKYYGPEGSVAVSTDLSKVTVPFWGSMGLAGTMHTRGSSDAFIHAASKHKKFTIISEPWVHYWCYIKYFLERDIAFFDYWLKGIDNGIMDGPAVDMMVRTGWRGYYWQDEDEWPIARTQYTKYYLDASPSSWAGDGKRNDFFKLDKNPPKEEKSATYDAGVEWENDNNWRHGVSFVTEPFAEDTLLAGYMKMGAWVSSTSKDMEFHASVRVMDEDDHEVPYPVAMSEASAHKFAPLAWGALKVSHRKLDPEKSTEYRPYHTHLEKDYQPLKPGEVVEIEVEMWPTTALIRKGYRLRVDVQPVSGDHIPMRIYDIVDQTYQKGSQNTIYTGPEHPTYLQLPVIPPKP